MFSLYYAYLYFLVDSHFGFKGKTLVMISPVPDHCHFFHTVRPFLQFYFSIYSTLISNLTNFCICSCMLKTSGVQ